MNSLKTINIPLAHPPWKKNGKHLESVVRKALMTFKMIEKPTKVAIALSGGKDSLSLLFLLNAISGRGFPKIELYAIHVDGEFSCGAGVYSSQLQAICTSLNIPFLSRTAPPEKDSLKCYSCSRNRRKLIFETAKSVGASIVAFGHHRDDQGQTLLMNLFHKGEFAGMLPKIAMVHFGITIIRPLIYVSEKDLVNFSKEYGFFRLSCQCPVGQHSMRKKVAHLIEEIEELFPHVRTNLSHAGLCYGSQKAAL